MGESLVTLGQLLETLHMGRSSLKPREVDVLLRYPSGRTLRLAKGGQIPFICLPDGEIRFDAEEIAKLLTVAGDKGADDA